MPYMGQKWNTKETKDRVLQEYYSGENTVAKIAHQYGIKPRTVYRWIEQHGHGTRAIRVDAPRRGVRLSYEETEVALLMILECENILPKKYLPTMNSLRDRILEVNEELKSIKEA